MPASYETDLYRRLHAALNDVAMIDTHEHLQRERELPAGDAIHFGRFFSHYASCDLVSAGMPRSDLVAVQGDVSLTPKDRWALIEPWYRKSWNTAYCEALRIAVRDLYGVDDLSASTVDDLTDAMRAQIRPGFTRTVFDKAGIEYAMMNADGPKPFFNTDFRHDCFVCDAVDSFTTFPFQALIADSGVEIGGLDDYLRVIDCYFERDGRCASAVKVGRAYDRTLCWEDVPRSAVEETFNRLLGHNDRPDRQQIKGLEDFILHYMCRKCGEYGVRMKFHTGIHEGNGNVIRNSRAAFLANLFLKYPGTTFDIYHISWPYHEEATVLAKNFANVTIDFCWNWVGPIATTRRALADMLDTVPASKIHGFGGDYNFVEGTYAHAVMARREIARVLAEKVDERRFTEEYAVDVGRMLLRDNAIENFGLVERRAALQGRKGE